MKMLCPACAMGPGGIDGHADLMVQTMGHARMCFRCAACQSLWLRTTARRGEFAWAPTAERALAKRGADQAVPPLSGSRWAH